MALRFRFHNSIQSNKSNFVHFVKHSSKNLCCDCNRHRLTIKGTKSCHSFSNLSQNCYYPMIQRSRPILRIRHGITVNVNAKFSYAHGTSLLKKNYLKLVLLGVSGIALLINSYSQDISELFSSLFLSPIHAGSRAQNNFIADVVDKTAHSVVFLEIKGKHPVTGKTVTLSNGSGFIVRKEGIVLTNAHVVANKSAVSVKLFNGQVYEGHVVAVDPITDLAAVKINTPDVKLTAVPLASSSDIQPGEWVIAMGSPLSLSNTVTCGIVSSIGRGSRELGLRNKEMDYIQTDAVINFGNSGGPLVNLEGHAIGINTMKVTTGISFAIPSDYAHTFLVKAEAMMKKGITDNGFLKRRYMGITMLTLTHSVMKELKTNVKVPSFPDVDGGVFVFKVIPGTPAHTGGILAGDIIIEMNGKKVRSAADVYDAVETSHLLDVTLIREQAKKTFKINTKEMKRD